MSFLFVDRIVNLISGKLIRGIKHVTWDDAYLTCTKDGKIVFPASLIGETLGQLAAWNVMAYHDFTLRPVAGIVAKARLLRPVYPGETLLLESVIDELDETAVRYHSIAKVGLDPVFIVEGAIGPLLPMTQFIEPAVVRRQFAEINRPDESDYWFSDSNVPKVPQVSLKQLSAKELPYRLPHLAFDTIREIGPGNHWEAEKLVSRSAQYFSDHFPNNPVLPMTVLLECIINLAYQFVAQLAGNTHYQIVELRKIKMNDFVHPGDVVVSQLKLKSQDADELILSCLSFVNNKRICVVEIVMSAVAKV